jgi:outer membrane scaffolding protein for murein synthesis (MipA/OmpV family)
MKISKMSGVRSTAISVATLTTLVVSASVAHADEGRPGQPNLIVGIGAMASPVYEGSDDTEIAVLPFVALNDFYGFNFRPVELSYNLIDTEATNGSWSLRAGPAVALAAGRDQDDDGDLRGLGDVDTGVTTGGFVDARLGPVMFGVEGAQEVADGHGGALVGLSLGTRLPLNDKLVFMPAVTGTWASEDYMDSFFGVTAAQAATSNYAAYEANAGFKDVGVEAALRYGLSNTWSFTWSVSYTRLIGDAADSPIVTGPGGTRDQVTGRIGVARGFTL